MGDVTEIQFTQQGYRQLVKALREVYPEPPEAVEPSELPQLVSGGEAAYLDPQGHTRWVKADRVPEVPDTWRPLLVGQSRREAAGQ